MEIILPGKYGGVVKYDKSDHELIKKYTWHRTAGGYCNAKMDNCKVVKMEKLLLNPERGYVVDHINHDRLDNRRNNLRILTPLQNSQNLSKIKRKNITSSFKGVSKLKNGKYRSNITIDGQFIQIGRYDSENEAAESYDMFIIHYPIKLYHPLNFKDNRYRDKPKPKPKPKKKHTSAFMGVYIRYIDKLGNIKYKAEIIHDKKCRNLMYTDNEIEAANAYDKYIVDNNIQQKILNFPEKYPNYDPAKLNIIKTFSEKVNSNTVRLLIKSAPKSNILIDKKDYDEDIKYYSLRLDKDGYAIINKCKYKLIKNKRLARYLLNETDPNVYIDHIDGNIENNTRKNLRHSNAQLNAQNKKKQKGTTSKYLNVSFKTSMGKWCVVIKINGITTHICTDTCEYNAAIKRDIYVMEHLSDSYYSLNFNDWTIESVKEWKDLLHYYPQKRIVKKRKIKSD